MDRAPQIDRNKLLLDASTIHFNNAIFDFLFSSTSQWPSRLDGNHKKALFDVVEGKRIMKAVSTVYDFVGKL